MNLKGLEFEDLELKGVEIVVVVVGEVEVREIVRLRGVQQKVLSF